MIVLLLLTLIVLDGMVKMLFSSCAADWQNERASSVYFLGDIINIEASVLQYHHTKLHVYFESCVATVTPDVNSVPRYTFIENHG